MADVKGHEQDKVRCHLSRSSQIIYLEPQEVLVPPAVQENQEALTVPLDRGALDSPYLLWGPACPGLGIQGSLSLLSLQEGLKVGEEQNNCYQNLEWSAVPFTGFNCYVLKKVCEPAHIRGLRWLSPSQIVVFGATEAVNA